MNTSSSHRDNAAAEPVRPDPLRLQFGLRGLFGFVTGLSILLAVMTWVGSTGSVLLLFLLILVAAHITGNALGTHLRDLATRTPAADRDEPSAPPVTSTRSPPERRNVASPSSPEQQEKKQLRRIALGASVACAFFGALVGAVLLRGTHSDSITLPAIALGSVSAAILGGWFGFLSSSFYHVTRTAWREALQDHKPH